MRTRFVEATQSVEGGLANHGKFMVGVFEPEEWERPCELDLRFAEATTAYQRGPREGRSLLSRCGWGQAVVFVADLQTGEGALFSPGGSPSADLAKHKVWVCPMFEPFLAWLYEHIDGYKDYSAMVKPLSPDGWFNELPALVEIPDVEFAVAGYRRAGLLCRTCRLPQDDPLANHRRRGAIGGGVREDGMYPHEFDPFAPES